jgi:hypothetical protein
MPVLLVLLFLVPFAVAKVLLLAVTAALRGDG